MKPRAVALPTLMLQIGPAYVIRYRHDDELTAPPFPLPKDNGFSLLTYSYPIKIKASVWNEGEHEDRSD